MTARRVSLQVAAAVLILIAASVCHAYASVPKGERSAKSDPAIARRYQQGDNAQNERIQSPGPKASRISQHGESGDRAAKADEDREIQRRLANANDKLAFFTGWLVFVGGLQIAALGLQVWFLRGTLDATKTAADAAKKGADTSYEAMKISERAYLHLEGCNRSFEVGKSPGVKMNIRNTGRTICTFRSVSTTMVLAADAPSEATYKVSEPSTLTLGAGAVCAPTVSREGPVTQEEYDAFTSGRENLYAFLRLEFTDVFGDDRAFGAGAKLVRGDSSLIYMTEPGFNYAT